MLSGCILQYPRRFLMSLKHFEAQIWLTRYPRRHGNGVDGHMLTPTGYVDVNSLSWVRDGQAVLWRSWRDNRRRLHPNKAERLAVPDKANERVRLKQMWTAPPPPLGGGSHQPYTEHNLLYIANDAMSDGLTMPPPMKPSGVSQAAAMPTRVCVCVCVCVFAYVWDIACIFGNK